MARFPTGRHTRAFPPDRPALRSSARVLGQAHQERLAFGLNRTYYTYSDSIGTSALIRIIVLRRLSWTKKRQLPDGQIRP